jgi:predicted MFS family arabinose efflux permease
LSGQPAQGRAGSLALVLIVTTLVQILLSIAISLPTVLAPVAARQMGIRPEALGIFMMLVGVMSMSFSPLSGKLIHRMGAFRLNQFAVLLVAVTLLGATTGNLYLVMLFALTLGFSQTTSISSAAHLLTRVTPPRRIGLVMAVRQAGVPVGAVLTGLMVPALLLVLEWPSLCALLAALMGVALLTERPLRPLVEGPEVARATEPAASLPALMRSVLAQPALRMLTICGFFYTFAQTALLVYIVSYLHIDLGYSLAAAGVVFALSQVAAFAGRLFWAWLFDRLGHPFHLLAWLGAVAASLCIAVASFTPAWPVWLVTVTVTLLGGTLTGWNSVYSGGVIRYAPPGAAGAITGAANSFGFIGNMVGPPVGAGVVLLTGHYAFVYLVAAAAIFPVAWMCRATGRRLAAADTMVP